MNSDVEVLTFLRHQFSAHRPVYVDIYVSFEDASYDVFDIRMIQWGDEFMVRDARSDQHSLHGTLHEYVQLISS